MNWYGAAFICFTSMTVVAGTELTSLCSNNVVFPQISPSLSLAEKEELELRIEQENKYYHSALPMVPLVGSIVFNALAVGVLYNQVFLHWYFGVPALLISLVWLYMSLQVSLRLVDLVGGIIAGEKRLTSRMTPAQKRDAMLYLLCLENVKHALYTSNETKLA